MEGRYGDRLWTAPTRSLDYARDDRQLGMTSGFEIASRDCASRSTGSDPPLRRSRRLVLEARLFPPGRLRRRLDVKLASAVTVLKAAFAHDLATRQPAQRAHR